MLTPSTPLAFTWDTVAAIVVEACARPAHMCGVPAEKSCRMMVSTTFVAFACALLMRSLVALEFQTVKPESAAMFPSSLTCRPKKATVVRSEKFQVAAPIVGSLRLLASAKPKISLCGPPGPPTAAMLGGGVNGFMVPTLALATCCAACCVTSGCVGSLAADAEAATAPSNTKQESASGARSARAKCLIC